MRLFHARLVAGCTLCTCVSAFAQPQPSTATTPAAPPPLEAVMDECVAAILRLQEAGEGADPAEPPSQWPYVGVYKVDGKTPVPYRIGGTAIAVMALSQSPRFGSDHAVQVAVDRGIGFLCEAWKDPQMSIADYEGGYDTRVWGHIEGLECLARLSRLKLVAAERRERVQEAMTRYLDGVVALEMPRTGGWNYARPDGREAVGAPAAFVTAAALEALYEATAAGMTVPEGPIDRGLDVLERARAATGSIVYAGAAGPSPTMTDGVPGAIGRMVASEAMLLRGGRGSTAAVRGAVDAFIVHWKWLDARRAKPGTHQRPYMVAPYYFMFAHRHAAQAVELLPPSERAEYRRRINELLLSVRSQDGSWNDRVFAPSAGYGTSMALLALMQPSLDQPTRGVAPSK
ncbi:MAG: hypothetical protein WCK33_06320 [Phycisphaerae bacterium]|jgi:hypothetical protein